jgi:hypothetical protein
MAEQREPAHEEEDLASFLQLAMLNGVGTALR